MKLFDKKFRQQFKKFADNHRKEERVRYEFLDTWNYNINGSILRYEFNPSEFVLDILGHDHSKEHAQVALDLTLFILDLVSEYFNKEPNIDIETIDELISFYETYLGDISNNPHEEVLYGFDKNLNELRLFDYSSKNLWIFANGLIECHEPLLTIYATLTYIIHRLERIIEGELS